MPYISAPLDSVLPVSEVSVTSTGVSSSMVLTVSSLPEGDLELIWAIRGDTGTQPYAQILFNGISTSDYTAVYYRIDTTPTLLGTGTDTGLQAYLRGPNGAYTAAPAGVFAVGKAVIPRYKETTNEKFMQGANISFIEFSGQNIQAFGGKLRALASTAAITSITFNSTAGNWASGSFLRARVVN